MERKFNIGEKVNINGEVVITTINQKANGENVYGTNRGFHITEETLSAMACMPGANTSLFDWYSFKAGKIAVHCDTEEKAKAFLAECDKQGIKWHLGEKLTELTCWDDETKETCYINRWGLQYSNKSYYSEHGYTIVESPFPAAPNPEPTLLYCQKEFKPGKWLTKGKVYMRNDDNYVKTDSGHNTVYDDRTLGGIPFKDYFVPLVKRPAKVGEWVLKIDDSFNWGITGQIYEVYKIDTQGDAWVKDHYNYCMSPSRYLVLDGYQPEPELFNGKVVCVKAYDGYSTLGKTYVFKDGLSTWDNGKEFPSFQLNTLNELNENCSSQFAMLIEA